MKQERFYAARLGRMDQLCSLRSSELDSGRGRGVRVVDVDNGSGLSFTVMPDRCCDIYNARFKGVPLAWLSACGIVNPNAYEPEGITWLRNWPGGLLTTAGFLNVGGPCEAGGLPHGLHGRASNLAAEDLKLERGWNEREEYELSVGGTVRHAMAFFEKLELRRRISTKFGCNTIFVHDEITNQGFAPSPLMVLYHCNFGYPLIDEAAHLEAKDVKLTPKDEVAAKGVADWFKLEAPQHGYAEQVLTHEIAPDADGLSRISVVNPVLKLRVSMAYDGATLPFLNQWKQMGEGDYVTGLEPANCIPIGQPENAKRGILRTIEPGETVKFRFQIEVKEL